MNPKILMFGWEFPPFNSGGLGTACYGLARSLYDKNAHVTFVLPVKIDVSVPFAKIVFANVEKVSSTQTGVMSGYITSHEYSLLKLREKVGDFYGETLLDEVLEYAAKAINIAKEEKPDIIHAHDWLSFPAGLEAKKATGKPLVLHVHATEFDRTGGQGVNQNVYEIERTAMEQADGIITVSNFTKEKVIKNYGISPDKITVVHNGIDFRDYVQLPPRLEELKGKGGQKIVLFAGRITIQKGPEYFVRAAKKVLEYNPDTLFVVAGSGDMQRQMMEETAFLGIGDRVIFTGFLRDDDLHALYQAADLYVMPSVSEPFGIAPLEAIANGTPVIISKQSGVSEVLTHALKVDFWDVDELANKIIGVLQHEPLMDTLREESQKEVGGITWDTAAKKVLNIYKKFFS